MDYAPIDKPPLDRFAVKPNLWNYDDARRDVTWDKVRAELDGTPGGGLNLAYECLDRHVTHGRGDKIAMLWEGKSGEQETYTFADMVKGANKAANGLRALGVEKGDRVFVFLERVPECYFTVFGTLKLGAVIGPLFSAFGPDAVKDRLQDSGAKVLVTSPELWAKVKDIRSELPRLADTSSSSPGDTRPSPADGRTCLRGTRRSPAQSDEFQTLDTDPEDYSVMHYTSGTTGKPKGAAHVHNAVIGHYATGKYVLDLHDDDIYWCTADPGWVTGTSYGMFAPWSQRRHEPRLRGRLQRRHVVRADREVQGHRLVHRAHGDPHADEGRRRSPEEARPLVAALHDVRRRAAQPGGRRLEREGARPALPRQLVADGDRRDHDRQLPGHADPPRQHGPPRSPASSRRSSTTTARKSRRARRATSPCKPGWPSMFRTYWQREELYDSRFQNGWYITGDRARMDADGYFWFVGRADDVINTAGHLVGPFEVESALIEHPAVAEAGVIGKPDPVAMEIVKAFVALKDGYEPDDKLRRELIRFTRDKLGPGVAPREIEFIAIAAQDSQRQDHAPPAEGARTRPARR